MDTQAWPFSWDGRLRPCWSRKGGCRTEWTTTHRTYVGLFQRPSGYQDTQDHSCCYRRPIQRGCALEDNRHLANDLVHRPMYCSWPATISAHRTGARYACSCQSECDDICDLVAQATRGGGSSPDLFENRDWEDQTSGWGFTGEFRSYDALVAKAEYFAARWLHNIQRCHQQELGSRQRDRIWRFWYLVWFLRCWRRLFLRHILSRPSHLAHIHFHPPLVYYVPPWHRLPPQGHQNAYSSIQTIAESWPYR